MIDNEPARGDDGARYKKQSYSLPPCLSSIVFIHSPFPPSPRPLPTFRLSTGTQPDLKSAVILLFLGHSSRGIRDPGTKKPHPHSFRSHVPECPPAVTPSVPWPIMSTRPVPQIPASFSQPSQVQWSPRPSIHRPCTPERERERGWRT